MARPVTPRQPMPKLEPARSRKTFAEVAQGYTAEAAIAEAGRCILCKVPRCSTVGCPLHNRIPEWIALIQQGRDSTRVRRFGLNGCNDPIVQDRLNFFRSTIQPSM